MALTDGLELAINFNSDVLDKSGNGRDGTVDGMTFDTSTPILGSGTGVFDGINDDVEIDVAGAKSGILDATVGTVALWTRFPTLAEYTRLFSVSTGGVASPVADHWHISFRGDDNNSLQVVCTNNGSIIMNAYTPLNTITDTNKHLIIVRAKASGNIEIMIDDVLELALSVGPLGAKFFGHAIDIDTMRIGSLERDTTDYRGDKDIDALAIWNRPITDAEATAYYNNSDGIELEAVAGIVILRRRMEG